MDKHHVLGTIWNGSSVDYRFVQFFKHLFEQFALVTVSYGMENTIVLPVQQYFQLTYISYKNMHELLNNLHKSYTAFTA